MTTISTPFDRTAIIPVSFLVFGLFVLSGSPTTFATGMVLFLTAGIAVTIMLVLWKELAATSAAMTASAPPLATLPSAGAVHNPWPDSGFRNSSRRRTRRS
jgi:hypothetical protein